MTWSFIRKVSWKYAPGFVKALGWNRFIWIMTHLQFAMPGSVLRQTANLAAFNHPNPSYPVHILIVPKKEIASLEQISVEDQGFLVDLFSCTQSLVSQLGLGENGYRLIANGGKYQDFPVLHFHLIADKPGGNNLGST
jgi:histidine triad (HIT) family protein